MNCYCYSFLTEICAREKEREIVKQHYALASTLRADITEDGLAPAPVKIFKGSTSMGARSRAHQKRATGPFPQFLPSYGRGIKCLRLWRWLRSRISLTVIPTVRGVQGRDLRRRRVQISAKYVCFALRPSGWSRYNYECRCCCRCKCLISHRRFRYWFCTNPHVEPKRFNISFCLSIEYSRDIELIYFKITDDTWNKNEKNWICFIS